MAKWLDKIFDAVSGAIEEGISERVKTKSTSRKVTATSSTLSAEFDELLDAFEKTSSAFLEKHGGEISYTVNFEHSKSGTSFEAGIIKCLRCGSKNRLRRGLIGAKCGQCKTPLQKVVN